MKRILVFTAIVIAVICLFMGCSCSRSIDTMSAEELLDLGNKYLADLDYEQAIVCFNKLIEIDPKNEQAHIGLADAYIGLGQMEEAITVLKEAIGIVDDPNPIMEKIEEVENVPNMPENDEDESNSGTGGKRPFAYEVDGDTLIIDGDGEMPDYYGDGKSNTFDAPWRGRKDITSIVIKEGITSIDDQAFEYLPALTTISIPASVTEIQLLAFCNCESLEAFIVAEDSPYYAADEFGILYSKDMTELICCPPGIDITDIEIPAGVKKIAPYAFAFCDIASIELPEGVVEIGSRAFMYCQDIKTFVFPSSVAIIGDALFFFCRDLEVVYFKGDAPATTDLNGIDSFDLGADVCVFYPEGASGWEEFDFGGVYSRRPWSPDLQWSIDGNNVLHISGNGIVPDCYAHNKYPSSSLAPWDEKYYTSVIIDEGITAVNGFAFYGDAVVSAVFPESLKELDGQAFNGCNNLSALYFKGDAPENITTAINSIGRNITFYYIEGKDGWDNLKNFGITTKTWDGESWNTGINQ